MGINIGRVLFNGCKERDGTGRVGKTNGNGYEKFERDGKMNGNRCSCSNEREQTGRATALELTETRLF